MPQNLPYPEGDVALSTDNNQRSGHKINQLLYNLFALLGGGGSGGVGLTLENWQQTADSSHTSGAATVIAPQTYFTRAIISAPSGNSDNVNIGPDNGADFYSLAPGETFTIQMPTGKKGDLNTWYGQSVSGTQTLRVAYVL